MTKIVQKLHKNFMNSLNGLKFGLTEHSFVLECWGALLLIPIIYYISQPLYYKIAMVTCYILLLATELLNTAIEKLCDRVTKDYDETIKIVKDTASAAVFLVLLINLILIVVGLFY